MVLDGPRLASGVANKDASEGAPAEVKLPGVTGGRDSVDEKVFGTPIPLPPVENTGTELKNESSNGETTEINRITNGGSGQQGGGAPQIANPRVKLATITDG